MSRIDLDKLASGGATDGQGPVWRDAADAYVPEDPAAGSAHVIQDEGTPLTQRANLDFVGAGVTVTDDAVNGKTVVTISGGGGGGSADLVVWTKILDTNPMAALTGFTSRSGTWTAGGTYGVNQTNAALQDSLLQFATAILPPGLRAIKATIRCTSAGKVGFSFGDSGTWSAGDVQVALDASNNTLWWDRAGTGGGTKALTVAQNTDYLLFVIEDLLGKLRVYVDGVYQTTITPAATMNTGAVGLYTRSASGWARDVSVWSGEVNFNLPT